MRVTRRVPQRLPTLILLGLAAPLLPAAVVGQDGATETVCAARWSGGRLAQDLILLAP